MSRKNALALFVVVMFLNYVPERGVGETVIYDKTFPLVPEGAVFLRSYIGAVTIAESQTPELRVVATIDAEDEEGMDSGKVGIRVAVTGDSISIGSEYRNIAPYEVSYLTDFDDRSTTLPCVTYRLEVPRACRLGLHDFASSIVIKNIDAFVHLQTFRGTVEVEGLRGSIDLETYKGDASVVFTAMERDSRIWTETGCVKLTLPSEAYFRIETLLGTEAHFDSNPPLPGPGNGISPEDLPRSQGVVVRISTDRGSIYLRRK